MTGELQTLEIHTGAQPAWSVIWLHGLGADGHDFEPIVAELDLPAPVRFVFPHAPVRPITVNGGYPMRAWYDIVSFERGGPEDEAGVRASARQIERLIDGEAERGTPAARVVLAGFSQGGAMALHTALRYPQPLAGIIALSAYLPLPALLAAERSAVTEPVPIFMAHGRDDPTVPEAFGARSRDTLRSAGCEVQWRTYPMGHTVCPQEVSDISVWLRARLQQPA